MASCAPHIIVRNTDPTAAPESIGDHWINTATQMEFRSLGTSSVNDWVVQPSNLNTLGLTFEAVSKNIRSWSYSLNYTGSTLTSIVYTEGVQTITKTFTYTGADLTSIVLSGDVPSGINLTKTLTYTSGNLTGVAYS